MKAHAVSPSSRGQSAHFSLPPPRADQLTNGNVVIIINRNQIAQLQVTSHAGCLASHTLHSTSVTKEDVSVICDEREAILVEDGSGVCLGNGETNRVAEALAERAGGDFNAGSIVGLWVTRGNAV